MGWLDCTTMTHYAGMMHCNRWLDINWDIHLTWRESLIRFNERPGFFIVDLEGFQNGDYRNIAFHRERVFKTSLKASKECHYWFAMMRTWTAREWAELAALAGKEGRL